MTAWSVCNLVTSSVKYSFILTFIPEPLLLELNVCQQYIKLYDYASFKWCWFFHPFLIGEHVHTVWGFGVAVWLSFPLSWLILILLLLSAPPYQLRWVCNTKQLLLWAPGVYLEMASLPGFRQVFKMCFISDRHLFVFTLEKAGQRTKACVWNRKWLNLSRSLFYWWNEFTISVPRKSSLPESDLLSF